MDTPYEGVTNFDWTESYRFQDTLPSTYESDYYGMPDPPDFVGRWNTASDYVAATGNASYPSDDGAAWQNRLDEVDVPSTVMYEETHRRSRSMEWAQLAGAFPNLSEVRRSEPTASPEDQLQRQGPRFEGDLYTALWVKGEGTERAGWCGYCPTWHRLNVSNYVSSPTLHVSSWLPMTDTCWSRDITCTLRTVSYVPPVARSMVRKAFDTSGPGKSFVAYATSGLMPVRTARVTGEERERHSSGMSTTSIQIR